MTDKCDDRLGHMSTILAQGGGNLNEPVFKSSNARALPGGGGGGMLKFPVDRRVIVSYFDIVALFIPASDMKNLHPVRTCNTCPTLAGFLGVVEFSGCAVLLYTSCMHLVTKYVIKIWSLCGGITDKGWLIPSA